MIDTARVCRRDALARFSWTVQRNEIAGGQIVYCHSSVSRTGTVTHELGHSRGLQHSPQPLDFMVSAANAAALWRYRPVVLGGCKVPTVLTVTVNFRKY